MQVPASVRNDADNDVMPDGNTIALVSVIATGTTAVLVPILVGWTDARRERRRLRHEREITDVSELRALLDETATKLGDVLARLSVTSETSLDEMHRKLLEDWAELLRLSGRVAVRIGSDHPAYHACESATTEVERLAHLLDPGREEPSDLQDRITESYESFDHAREDFYDAAQRVIGSRIEHDAEGPFDRLMREEWTWRERLDSWWYRRRIDRQLRKRDAGEGSAPARELPSSSTP